MRRSFLRINIVNVYTVRMYIGCYTNYMSMLMHMLRFEAGEAFLVVDLRWERLNVLNVCALAVCSSAIASIKSEIEKSSLVGRILPSQTID